jgi:hypothetical protein
MASRKLILTLIFELTSVVRRRPAGNGVSTEAEESPLLEAVTTKRLLESVAD